MLDSKHKEVCINQFMSTLTNHVYCVYIQVKKRDVMNYTGDGEPPFCMIMISAEIVPSHLKFDVFLAGVDKPNRFQLTRETEYSNSQLCKLNEYTKCYFHDSPFSFLLLLIIWAHALPIFICIAIRFNK